MTRRARFAVPGDPSAVAFARDRVITQIRAWGVRLGEEQQDAVRLVTSDHERRGPRWRLHHGWSASQ